MSHPQRPSPAQPLRPDHSQTLAQSSPDSTGKAVRPTSKSQNWAIEQLPGLSLQHQTQLHHCGIQTTQQLLQRTQTPAQRQSLATQLQIHIQHLNKWVALSNLARIPAVGCQHCGLLLHAGVSSPAQLAQTAVPRLHQQILRLHLATMQRQDLCPSFAEVAVWIDQAKQVRPLPKT
jgi:Domain of unknown function (DUF4332)